MSCSTQVAPAAFLSYLGSVAGVSVTQLEWHALTRLAESKGFMVGRSRLDVSVALGTLDALSARLGDTENSVSFLATQKVLGSAPSFTANANAVMQLFVRDGVVSVLSQVRMPEGDVFADAKNLLSSADRLTVLADVQNVLVQTDVASHVNTPAGSLVKLSSSRSKVVRRAVGLNPSTPTHVLAALGEDKDWEVRWAVAGNVNAPREVLDVLKDDMDFVVSDTASESLRLRPAA